MKYNCVKPNPGRFVKGFIPWNKGKKGVQTWSEESRTKARLSHLGKPGACNWLGKKHSTETKLKISLSQRGKKGNNWKGGPPTKCVDCNKNINPTNYDTKRCHSCENKRRWANPEYANRVGKKAFRALFLYPNKPETVLIKLLKLEKNNLFKYTGDGKKFIGRFCPDFIDEKNKKIIELYGDYWHKKPEAILRDKRRAITYKEHGYKLLIIWEHELKHISRIKNKINLFKIGK